MHTVLHVLWIGFVTLGAIVGIVGVLVIIGAILLANDEASGDNPFE